MTAACPSQDPDNLLTGEAQGYAAAQIFYDVFKVRSMFLITIQVLVVTSASHLHAMLTFDRTGADLWGLCMNGCLLRGVWCAHMHVISAEESSWQWMLQGRFGNGAGGIVLLAIPLLSFFNGTVISMGTNARMLWAFSRDRG